MSALVSPVSWIVHASPTAFLPSSACAAGLPAAAPRLTYALDGGAVHPTQAASSASPTANPTGPNPTGPNPTGPNEVIRNLCAADMTGNPRQKPAAAADRPRRS